MNGLYGHGHIGPLQAGNAGPLQAPSLLGGGILFGTGQAGLISGEFL